MTSTFELSLGASSFCYYSLFWFDQEPKVMLDLKTERLQFRQWSKNDVSSFTTFFSSEKDARFVGGVKTPEEAWRLMATYIGHYELLGYSYLAIETIDSKQLIGTVGLWNSHPWPEPELGYWLLPSAQGKGFGREAGTAVYDYARQMELPSLVSYIDPANEPSKKLALAIGAQLDGMVDLLDFGPHEVYRYW